MKKIRFSQKMCIGALVAGIVFSHTYSFATENLQALYTEDFINWQTLSEEEKENNLMPRTYTVLTSAKSLEDYTEEYVSYRQQILARNFTKSFNNGLISAATYNSPAYNLNSDISVPVKHQGSTNQCWAFSMLTALETNLEINRDIQKTFSPRHMDYSTARTFTDGINPLGYGREVGDGGLSVMALSYLTNGQGAVLESEMPFENNEDKISLSELEKEVDTIVTEYVSFPSIYKEYDMDTGEVTYTNGGSGSSLINYKDSEVEQLRNAMKDHIIKYGAISTVTAANYAQFYNNADISKATAYFCNDNSIIRDHAVTIVGWDDNYSKENFTGVAKPYNDGAYIALNTYGVENFNKGYLYISYEDALIESYLYGIKSTSDIDYDKLYQYNPYGDNIALGTQGRSEGYIASVYTRNASKNETLNYVGLSIPDSVSLEIYVNPNGNSTLINSLIKVGETDVLAPGYHRIAIEPTKLTGNSFSVVIKQKSTENRFYFSLETGLEDSIFENVTGNPGKTLYSFDGYSWKSISKESITGLDMKKSDLCIKAFTEFNVEEPKPEEEPSDNPDEEITPDAITLSSIKYMIKESDIYRIQHNTTLKTFKENIVTNSKTIKVLDEKGIEIKDDELIKTGMILKLSDQKEYELVVRGDMNCSGNISLIDLSKFLAHYTDDPGCALEGAALKAADLSCDGRISLLDLSQMIVLYTSID